VYARIYQILALEDAFQNQKRLKFLKNHQPSQEKPYTGKLTRTRTQSGSEEIYAYNLSNFIAILARKGIIPPANPVRLYDEVTLEMILETLREVYHYPFKNIVEYFTTRGIIPLFLKEASPEKIQEILKTKGRLDPEDMFEIDPKYDEKTVTQHTLTEILAEAEYEESALKVLLKLLETLAKH